MASLETLPEELLLCIIEHASQHVRAANPWRNVSRVSPTILNLCRTNRRFNRLAIPYLYREFSFSLVENPELFVNVIARSPELADYVHHVGWSINPSHYNTRANEFVLPQKLKEMESPHPRELGRVLQEEKLDWHHDQYLAGFLMLTPNVASLSVIDTFPFKGDHPRSWMETIRLCVPHTFHHLRSVTVDGYRSVLGIVPLFLLPSMRTLRIVDVTERARPDPEHTNFLVSQGVYRQRVNALVGVSNIETLQLARCCLDSRLVEWLLTLCAALKVFQHDFHHLQNYGNEDRPETAHIELCYDKIAKGLERHVASLEYLELDHQHGRYNYRGDTLGSLDHFLALKTLRVPPTALSQSSNRIG